MQQLFSSEEYSVFIIFLPMAAAAVAINEPVVNFKGSQSAGYYTFFHCCLIRRAVHTNEKRTISSVGPLKRDINRLQPLILFHGPHIQPTCTSHEKSIFLFPRWLTVRPSTICLSAIFLLPRDIKLHRNVAKLAKVCVQRVYTYMYTYNNVPF